MRNIMRFGAFAAVLLSALSIASYGVTLGSDKFVSRTSTATHIQSARIGNQFLRGGFTATDFLSQHDVKGTAPLATPFNSLARVDSAVGAVHDAPVDIDGDGKTDFVVTRDEGGSLIWYYAQNGGTAWTGTPWGLSTDWALSEDFDGDGKDDYVVWRPAPTGSAFYIYFTATGTYRAEAFGQEGDVPSIIGDYDGDGVADIAVYRPGATEGAQSYWFYIPSNNNPSHTAVSVPWGIRNDILAPGDYNGDGKNDFGIARNDGTGHLVFWFLLSDGTVAPAVTFGTTADLVVPGDYDGDGKTDIATVRSVNGHYQWQYYASSNGTINYALWGSAGDLPAQGDYDGDGKTDFAIYRRSTTPGQTGFWVLNSSNGSVTSFAWGQSGDIPVATSNVF